MIEATITRRQSQARDIVVLDLVSADGAPLPPFTPGAHIDVEIGQGLVRQYSLCGDPAEGALYRIGVLKDPASRGGSAAIHAGFAEGATIRIGEPRNLFPLAEDAAFSVLMGGGIGITPMIAMAHALHTQGRPFALHYCAREKDSAAFLAEMATAPWAANVTLHFDSGEDATRPFDPATDLPDPATGAHVYTCGPAGFMDFVLRSAADRGYPEAQLHKEYFSVEVETGGDSFEVELAQSGQTVTVGPDQTIVQALTGIGIAVEVSCEQGICGTCLCDLLEGEADHRDSFLTDAEKAEGDQIMLCCSRAKSQKLVLDL
ncbi:PDR/VanB family oxidoreductase [Pseudooceanicola sp. CBS1P-1]|uniref:2Fe-2S iron-sulfur cluster binding domain-containing protein n=1 Tax=Pseudooceanicola albus TaxID=2692189 RepID=A0A6L7G024_9RHOB|nr:MULTISPECIES: PDR/VanB family oxidoreductase [Pseudooceanicola]MBT9383560.1 PDR/VanB family oxidoreductase [Pseudooceanicola endophyticus]MXN17415.1 2Fe-2S iron-sulfur cluster binding domain-containing protein [Pseudooceanicola albus]